MMDMGKKKLLRRLENLLNFLLLLFYITIFAVLFSRVIKLADSTSENSLGEKQKKNVPTRAHSKWLSLHFTLANREKNCFLIARALLHRSMMCANLEGWGHLLSDAWRQRRKTLFAHCSHHCDDFSIRFPSTVNLFRADLNLMNTANMRLTLAECEVQRISLNVELHRRELIGMVKNTQQKLCWDCRERSRSPSRRAMKWKTHIFKQLIRNFKDPCC